MKSGVFIHGARRMNPPDFSCRQVIVLIILLKEKVHQKIAFHIIEFHGHFSKRRKKYICFYRLLQSQDVFAAATSSYPGETPHM